MNCTSATALVGNAAADFDPDPLAYILTAGQPTAEF